MATQVFLLSAVADTHRGDNSTHLSGVTVGWQPLATGTSRGGGVVASANVSTVTGPTNGIELIKNNDLEWLSPPLAAAVTISGTITCNVWAAESDMNANVAINVFIERVGPTGAILSTVVKTARTTEVAITTRAANNFTATPTSTAFAKGDRIRIRIFGDDAGTMATAFSFNASYNGSSVAADGDTYVTFTETFSFATSDPAGTTLYLTDTASDVVTAAVDREMWTARGGGVLNDVRDSGTGWTAPLQMTDTAGGTVVDWYSKQLQAFTLAGKAKVNLRANESASGCQAAVGVELARVNADGTGASVWGYANKDAAAGSVGFGSIATTETAYPIYVNGDDLAFTDGQRLRVRVFADDSAINPLALAGVNTVTIYYNGTSGGASGDTYLTLPQSVTEYLPPGKSPPFGGNRRTVRNVLLRM